MDTLQTWAALALLGWLYGAAQGWWLGPLGFAKLGIERTKERWSEPDFVPDDDEDANFANPDDEDQDDDVEEVSGGALVRSIPRRASWGPRPLNDLRAEVGLTDDEDDQDDDEDLPRAEWVARQVDAGRRTTDIREDGALRYGVTTRTIDNDLKVARERRAARARGGKMGGSHR